MKYAAIIIENRFTHEEMVKIINKHSKFIPEYIPIIHINDPDIKTANDYNELLTRIDFWKGMPYDVVLIFQHDSGLLRKGIEEFLEYDFIGAPLYHIDFPSMNGGLSIRSRKAMIKCIEHKPYHHINGNEDIYFCQTLKEIGGDLPTKEVAQKFSVETIFGLGSLGYHAIGKWHSEEKVNQILNQYK